MARVRIPPGIVRLQNCKKVKDMHIFRPESRVPVKLPLKKCIMEIGADRIKPKAIRELSRPNTARAEREYNQQKQRGEKKNRR